MAASLSECSWICHVYLEKQRIRLVKYIHEMVNYTYYAKSISNIFYFEGIL